VGFSSAKKKKKEKERENREKKEERYTFEKHNLLKFIFENYCERFCYFHNNHFRKRAFT